MGRRTSEDRLKEVRNDLVFRLPWDIMEPGRVMEGYQFMKNAELILAACMMPEHPDRLRLEQAVRELAYARHADRESTPEERGIANRVCGWIDRWLLTREPGEGIFADATDMARMRTKLLVRARDIERRKTIGASGGRAMRLVISDEMSRKLRDLMAAEGIDNQQALIERVVRQAHETAFGKSGI